MRKGRRFLEGLRRNRKYLYGMGLVAGSASLYLSISEGLRNLSTYIQTSSGYVTNLGKVYLVGAEVAAIGLGMLIYGMYKERKDKGRD